MSMRRSMVYSRPPQKKITVGPFSPTPHIPTAGENLNLSYLSQSQAQAKNTNTVINIKPKREIESADSKRLGEQKITQKLVKTNQQAEEEGNANWKLLKIHNIKENLTESLPPKVAQNLTDGSGLSSPKRIPRELSPRKNAMVGLNMTRLKRLELAKHQLKLSHPQQNTLIGIMNDGGKQIFTKLFDSADQKNTSIDYTIKTQISINNALGYRPQSPVPNQKSLVVRTSPIRLKKPSATAVSSVGSNNTTVRQPQAPSSNPSHNSVGGVNYINLEKNKIKADDEKGTLAVSVKRTLFHESRNSPVLSNKKGDNTAGDNSPTKDTVSLSSSFPAPINQVSTSSNMNSNNISSPKNAYKVSLNFPKGNNYHITNTKTILEMHKIAEIKRNLALSTTSSQRALQRKSSHHITHHGDLFSHDISVFSEIVSNPDDDDHEFNMPYEDEEIEESTTTTRQQPRRIILLQSVYEGRPTTVLFTYPPCCEKTRDISRTIVVKPEDESKYDLKFKSGTLYCVIKAFEYAGFKRTAANNWNAMWGKPKQDRIKDMNKYQKVNHFPGCWQLGRKDNLWRNLSRMKRQFPNDFNFVPNTYLLNTDFDRFSQIKETSENKSLWIMKPCASACGRGIRLLSKKSKLKKKMNYLTQEYIANPHLINGLKYDLRIYVLVSCYDPLRIYLYNQGLVRFATQKYSVNNKSLKQRFVHLTNWSVNKNSETFVKNEDANRDGMGSKWSFQALFKKYSEMGINHRELFEKIRDIIIKTIICAEPYMLSALNRSPEHRNNCFELYGFDILIDSNLKPWIMEVNVCPSLNSSSPLDKKIKTSLISDMMNLIGYQAYDKKKYEDDLKKKTPGTNEGRKYQYKNVNDILDLNEDNCVEKLNPDDWNILFETDEEMYRRGDFERIFPIKENVDNYAKYFEFQRYNNIIVSKWLQSKTNFLEKICKKLSNVAV